MGEVRTISRALIRKETQIVIVISLKPIYYPEGQENQVWKDNLYLRQQTMYLFAQKI